MDLYWICIGVYMDVYLLYCMCIRFVHGCILFVYMDVY